MLLAAFRRSFLDAPLCRLATALVIGLSVAASTTTAAESSNSAPSVDPRLKALVERHLRNRPDYQSGDLLSRMDVEPIFNELLELGLSPTTDGESLYGAYLRDDAYLVRLLESPQGKAFMRKVNRLPDAYDRLERLSWSTAGQQWLKQLVAAENGDKLFADMLTEDGMKAVAETLKDDPSGRNFHLPTGRVYTDEQMLARLQRTIASQRPKSTKTESATGTK